ncbi:MAG: hypothetical protein A2252_11775 [Elusimicrobia bacterium RIFOXYA2_FULL_39_19]|nr:MAG: hypothetical protein A2252_11775 [Elusimicrobia bacterium RIFOXYA2_FULL_39_19]
MKKNKIVLHLFLSLISLVCFSPSVFSYTEYECFFSWVDPAVTIRPMDVVVDGSNKHVFMTDAYSERMVEFDGTGAVVNTYVLPGDYFFIAMDDDYVYSTVLDYLKTPEENLIIKTPKNGGSSIELCRSTQSEITPGMFYSIQGIAVDSDYMYVGDSGDDNPGKITKLDKVTGAYVSDWTFSSDIRGITLDGTTLYVCISDGVRRCTTDGVDTSGAWASVTFASGRPIDIDIGPDNKVYILLGSTQGVHVYDKEGNYLTQFGGPYGSGKGEFNFARGGTSGGIGIDKVSGNIYVADNYNSRIQVFRGKDGSGTLFTPLGSVNTGVLKPVDNICLPEDGNRVEIAYYIAADGLVTMKIYNQAGVLVCTLIPGEFKNAGLQTVFWGGENDSGDIVASGIYLVHIEAPGLTDTKKVCIIRK